MVRILF